MLHNCISKCICHRAEVWALPDSPATALCRYVHWLNRQKEFQTYSNILTDHSTAPYTQHHQQPPSPLSSRQWGKCLKGHWEGSLHWPPGDRLLFFASWRLLKTADEQPIRSWHSHNFKKPLPHRSSLGALGGFCPDLASHSWISERRHWHLWELLITTSVGRIKLRLHRRLVESHGATADLWPLWVAHDTTALQLSRRAWEKRHIKLCLSNATHWGLGLGWSPTSPLCRLFCLISLTEGSGEA